MRRAAFAALALAASEARAEEAESSTRVVFEAGAEADSNVARVDTRPGNERIAAGVGRLGARFSHRGVLAGGNYAITASGLARVVVDPAASDESTALTIADLRWSRQLGERPVSAGVAIAGADASGLAGGVGSRTFRSLGADGLLAARGGEGRVLTLALGMRVFQYKIDSDFDWIGPAATMRLEATLWEPSGGTRSVELSAYAGVEARAFGSRAAANACPDGQMPVDPRECQAGTSLNRRDRYHRLGAELSYTGGLVAAASYQLSVTDSNSFGQSLVRHRASLSATKDLPWKLYVSALAILQLDQFLDGLIVQQDLQNQIFTTLDDENRSSLQVRVARQLSEGWALEARGAVWRDLGSDVAFRRGLIYVGAIYGR
jgi:hypothetical protein